MPKKTNQRLTNADILELIARQTSLTKAQCKEFSDAYSTLFKRMVCSEYIEDGFEFPVMDILTIKLKERRGVKKGDTYKMVDVDRDETGKFIIPADHPKGAQLPIKTMIATEDKPDFLMPYMRIRPSIREAIRKSSEEAWIKRHEKDGES